MGPPGEGKGKGEGRGGHQKKVRPDKKSCKKVWTEFVLVQGIQSRPVYISYGIGESWLKCIKLFT